MLLRGESSPQTKVGLVWDPAGQGPQGAPLLGGTLFPSRPPRWTETHSPAGPSVSLPALKYIPIPLPCPGRAVRLAVTQVALGRISSHPHFTPATSASPPRLPAGMTAADQIRLPSPRHRANPAWQPDASSACRSSGPQAAAPLQRARLRPGSALIASKQEPG